MVKGGEIRAERIFFFSQTSSLFPRACSIYCCQFRGPRAIQPHQPYQFHFQSFTAVFSRETFPEGREEYNIIEVTRFFDDRGKPENITENRILDAWAYYLLY